MEKANFPVVVLCQVLQVSRSGYYDYQNRKARPDGPDRQRLIVKVRAIHFSSRQTYGSRRMSKALKEDGEAVGRYQARTLMRQAAVAVRRKKHFKVTTDSRHDDPVALNLLNRKFEVGTPNRVWAADITSLWTEEGWLYLAVVLDLFSRKVVGWSMSSQMKAGLVGDALRMALLIRKPDRGLIHHSDRGSQYAGQDYQALLSEYGMICSMSRKGNCWDNAVAERFFRSLKSDQTEHRRYATREEAKKDVIDYIEMFYNSRRYHSYLGYVSPAEYEKLAEVS